MVEGDHEHRIGRGPFAFLGVPEDADDETIARAASTLARRWRQAEQDDSLPDAARTKAGELHAGVSIAKKLISDAEKREVYLLRRDTTGELFITATGLKEGPALPSRAASARESRGRSSGSGNKLLDRAHVFMAKNDFRSAVALLKQAREQDPSSPQVFAALGWATWNDGGASAAEDAEDYLRLALTFDARSIEALTYLVKVYMAQSRFDNARPLVRMLIRLDSDSSWAKRTLSEIDARLETANGNPS
jgi:tetratricopeptide (TPR) repeat protein